MRRSKLALSAATLAMTAGMAMAQVAPIGPFVGDHHEDFTVIGQWPPTGPCTFCETIPGAFGGICTLESVSGSNIHVTGGWGYICSIGPHATPRISASTGGGGYDYHFSPGSEAGQFGGYFGTNCGVPNGTAEFYDVSNNLIGSQPITFPADCSWTWRGWSSSVPISRVRIIGTGPGAGYVMMDDMEYMPGYTGPTGACCIPSTLTCAIMNATACTAFSGVYHGDGSTCAVANCPTPGACCRHDGTCTQSTPAACTSQVGVYRGDSTSCATAACPVAGACCLATGYCVSVTSSACAGQGGVYRGDGTSCTTANCPLPPGVWLEVGEAGDFIETANITTGNGPLNQIRGTLGASDADMYAFRICSPGTFSASTVGGATYNTQLFLFSASGLGIAASDDAASTQQSRLSSQFTASQPAGVFFIAVSAWDKDPIDSATHEIWNDQPSGSERAPDGPGAANPIASWDTGGGATGAYAIVMTGSCFAQAGPASCYANCDSSTTQPCLNVLDFTCFLNAFAAASTYANCDASTQAPVLNVLDFTCFLNRFAAGCSGC